MVTIMFRPQNPINSWEPEMEQAPLGVIETLSRAQWDMSPGGHSHDYYPGTISFKSSHYNLLKGKVPIDKI